MTNFKHKPILSNTKITLQPFNKDDWKIMKEILTDFEVQKLTGSVLTSEEARNSESSLKDVALKKWYQSRNDQADRLDLAIIDNTTNTLVGEVVLNDWDEDMNSCNYRILIGPNGRNKGFGSEATKMIVNYALNELKLHRIELEVYDFNPRARHVYERSGFVLEGIKRDSFKFDGEWIDTLIYSIINKE